MTLLRQGAAGPGSVHVLIISVGKYDDPGLDPLNGAVLSAERLADFWLSCALPPGRKAGSVDVLVSHAKPVQLNDDHGVAQAIQPATYAAVGDAIQSWAQRTRSAALGVLHWIGHGEVLSRIEEGNSTGYALYCEDLQKGPGGRLGRLAYSWERTQFGLERATDADLLCILDTCQLESGFLADYGSALPSAFGERIVKAKVLLPGRVGSKAMCVEPGVDVGGDFKGGAIFSEAALLALKHYGAVEMDDRVGAAVYLEELGKAMDCRFARWSRRRPPAPIPRIFSRSGERMDEPLVLPSAPKGMIDLSFAGDRARGRSCIIERNGTALAPIKPVNDIWEADLDHGSGYVGSVHERFTLKPKVAGASRAFTVDSPHRRVTVNRS